MKKTDFKEILKHENWIIFCKNEHELALILNECIDLKLSWSSGKSIKTHIPSCDITSIHYRKKDKGITFDKKCNIITNEFDIDTDIVKTGTNWLDITLPFFYETLR